MFNNKVYLVFGGAIHHGCLDDWANMDDTVFHDVFRKHKSAVAYIEDLLPGYKVEGNELVIYVNWDNADKFRMFWAEPGDKVKFWIEEHIVH